MDRPRIEDGQDEDRQHVVGDGVGRYEHLQPGRDPRAEDRQHAQGEGHPRIGGRRPARRRVTRIEGEIDGRGRDDAPQSGQQRRQGRAPVGEGSGSGFAPDLQPQDEEEDRQQALRAPLRDAQAEDVGHRADAHPGVHQVLIGGRERTVGADQGEGGGRQQNQARRGRQVGERPGGAPHPGAHGPLQRLQHGVEVPGPVVAQSVDEDGGGGGHAVGAAVGEILLDLPPQLRVLEVPGETGHVEVQRGGDLEQSVAVERRLVGVERVVHVPEAALAARRLGADRHQGRTRVGALVREMPEGVDHPLAERLAQALQHGPQSAAVRAEIVAVDHDHDTAAACAAATDMIAAAVDRTEKPVVGCVCAHPGRPILRMEANPAIKPFKLGTEAFSTRSSMRPAWRQAPSPRRKGQNIGSGRARLPRLGRAHITPG